MILTQGKIKKRRRRREKIEHFFGCEIVCSKECVWNKLLLCSWFISVMNYHMTKTSIIYRRFLLLNLKNILLIRFIFQPSNYIKNRQLCIILKWFQSNLIIRNMYNSTQYFSIFGKIEIKSPFFFVVCFLWWFYVCFQVPTECSPKINK